MPRSTTEAAPADLGTAYAAFRGLRRPVMSGDCRDAPAELLRIGGNAPAPVVIDEFTYLVSATPGSPSCLQQALSPLSHAKEHARTRLILCGCALTTMEQLLGGGAPLRGRASMELVVRPFRFRSAPTRSRALPGRPGPRPGLHRLRTPTRKEARRRR